MTPDSTISFRAGARRDYVIDFGPWLRSYWEPGAGFAASAYCRPRTPTGFAYQNGETTGQSGSLEPLWPTVLGGQVDDGALTWTAVATGTNGTDPIESIACEQIDPPDDELQVTPVQASAEEIQLTLLGGTSGNSYFVEVTPTTTEAGEIQPFLIQVNVR